MTRRRSITEDLAAADTGRQPLRFEGALKRDVDEALALRRAGGDAPVGVVARLLKVRHKLPQTVGSIRGALSRYAGGRW